MYSFTCALPVMMQVQMQSELNCTYMYRDGQVKGKNHIKCLYVIEQINTFSNNFLEHKSS